MLKTSQAPLVSPSDLFPGADAIVPTPKHGSPNFESLQAWANAPGEDRDIRAGLARNVRVISFPELKAALCEVVRTVNDLVARERLVPALLLGRNEWSSNGWITGGIAQALRFQPCTSGHLREMGVKANQALVETAQSKNGNAFIIFDDAVFSGQQIELDVAQQLKMVSTYLSPAAAERLLASKIIIAPAFSTAHGKAHALESCHEFGFKDVAFITGPSPIQTIGELFSSAFISRLQTWRRHSTRAPLERLSLTLFEHGCPDDESSLLEVTRHLGPIRKPYRPGFNFRTF